MLVGIINMAQFSCFPPIGPIKISGISWLAKRFRDDVLLRELDKNKNGLVDVAPICKKH